MTTIVRDELEEIFDLEFNEKHHIVCIDCYPEYIVPLPTICGKDASKMIRMDKTHPDIPMCVPCVELSPHHICKDP